MASDPATGFSSSSPQVIPSTSSGQIQRRRRFVASVSDADVNKVIAARVPKNTVRSTTWGVKYLMNGAMREISSYQ